MSLSYVIVPRRNPSRPNDPKKFYALAQSEGTVTVEKIVKRIAERASYSRGELEGCISEFLIELENVLEDGYIAQLGRIGNFRLTIQNAGGTDTLEEFHDGHIAGCKVKFHPSTQLSNMCRTMKFKLYQPKGKKAEVKP